MNLRNFNGFNSNYSFHHQYWEGNPAKFSRDLTQKEKEQILADVEKLYNRAKDHETETLKNAYQKDVEMMIRKYGKISN